MHCTRLVCRSGERDGWGGKAGVGEGGVMKAYNAMVKSRRVDGRGLVCISSLWCAFHPSLMKYIAAVVRASLTEDFVRENLK